MRFKSPLLKTDLIFFQRTFKNQCAHHSNLINCFPAAQLPTCPSEQMHGCQDTTVAAAEAGLPFPPPHFPSLVSLPAKPHLLSPPYINLSQALRPKFHLLPAICYSGYY